jgi:predicted DNA-binding protein (UPF0251 family)
MNPGNRQQEVGSGAGLVLVPRRAIRPAMQDELVLREGSTGRAVVVLPRVWAVGDAMEGHALEAGRGKPRLVGDPTPASRPKVEVAFYRKYSEAMLRRYLRLSMEAGRVPSLLGREMFRGNVTSYRVHSFEDVVVFCMDVETCLARLNAEEKAVIRRIALQEYTQAEAAAVLGMNLRAVVRQYGMALDKLTTMFLKARMLEPLKSCQ